MPNTNVATDKPMHFGPPDIPKEMTGRIGQLRHQLPKDVLDAADAIVRASDAYAEDVADADKNWNRLPAGAGADRIQKANAEADERIAAAVEVAQAAATVAAADLEAKSLPAQPAKGDLALAREELRTRLAAAPPNRVGTELARIAAGPRRDLAALAMSDYAESIAAGRGGTLTAQDRSAIRSGAIAGTLKHGSEAEKAAASALKELRRSTADAVGSAKVYAKAKRQGTDTGRRNTAAAAALREKLVG